MPRFLMSLVLVLPVLAQVAYSKEASAEEVAIDQVNQVKITGPIQVRVTYGDHARLEFDPTQTRLTQDSKHLSLQAETPTFALLEVPSLERLTVVNGVLQIKVDGHKRFAINTLEAPSIRLELADQGRFDSKTLVTEHLQVDLQGQGRASLAHVEADLIELDLSDHGDIDVAGQTRQQQVALSGYAYYDGEALQSTEATVALDDFSAGLIQAANEPVVRAAPYTSLTTR